MLELNKVLLVGNLTRDPELRYLPSGTAIADLSLALNRRSFDRNSGERKDETVFIDVTAWEKQAEFCKNYLSKGRAIFIEGRLRQEKWEDKQTGQARSKISVVAERVQFADSKPQGGGESFAPEGMGSGAPEPAPSRYQERPAAPAPAPQAGGAPKSGANTEDDLPF